MAAPLRTSGDAELKRWALLNGKKATLSDGSVFNSSGHRIDNSKATPLPAKEKVVEQVASMPMPTEQKQDDRRVASLEDMVRRMSGVIEDIGRELATAKKTVEQLEAHQVSQSDTTTQTVAPTVAPAPALVKWKFKVVRDSESGFIKDIVATPEVMDEENPNDLVAAVVRLAQNKF